MDPMSNVSTLASPQLCPYVKLMSILNMALPSIIMLTAAFMLTVKPFKSSSGSSKLEPTACSVDPALKV